MRRVRARPHSHTPAAAVRAAAPVDLTVPWAAKLIQPGKVATGSQQTFVVDVTGPAILDGPVQLNLGAVIAPATWEGEPGQRRRCSAVATIPAGGSRILRVHVLPIVPGQQPRLRAGTVVVTR